MKKNNKGFFLAETIIIVALVTTVMAFVYPNVSKLYDNYKNTSLYYDQTEDLYTLKAYSEVYATDIIGKCNDLINLPEGSSFSYNICEGNCGMGIKTLFIYKYMYSPSSDTNYNFNKYLKRLKKTSNDQKACRLVGVFENGSKPKRYASIKIEKESLYRQLYSVPELEVKQYVELDLVNDCNVVKDEDKTKVSAVFDDVTNTCKITASESASNSDVMVSITAIDGTKIDTKVHVK